jgi:tripartite-type tricarboxylate transporter receptor subunit TctC
VPPAGKYSENKFLIRLAGGISPSAHRRGGEARNWHSEETAMNFTRCRFLNMAAVAVVASAFPQLASPLDYPVRPVRLVVGYAAGGSTDIVARLMGQWLSERLGQQFIIENRPGAGTNIATESVVHAQADGYTLLMVSPSHAINATLYEKLNYNFVRDLAPVAGFIRVPLVMAVNPAVPAGTVPEFISLCKGNSGKINMASAGVGTSDHVAGELFKAMTGVDMLHVPYRGAGPALTDLLGGQVQVIFEPVPSIIEYIRSGKLRALAVTTSVRSAALPDTPSLSDFVLATRPVLGSALLCPKIHLPRSSTGSTGTSTQFLPTPE